MSSHTVFSQLRGRRPFGMNRLVSAAGLAALVLLGGLPGAAHGQFPGTFTRAGGNNFSNVDEWNFTAGFSATNPVPFSNPTGVLTVQVFGTNGPSATNDFNLTLNTINFNAFSPTANFGLSNTLGGTYTFAGAGKIQLNGDGGGSGSGTFGANMAVGFVMGSTATGVTINSAGSPNGINALNTNISGTVSSNTYSGGPLVINTGGLANTGVLTMNSANTFAGGVSLVSGNMNLNNASAIGIFGNILNTLTINSTTSGAATIEASAATQIINSVVTNSGGGDLVLTGGRGNEAASLTLGGLLGLGVSGNGNVVVRPAGTSTIDNFQGINTYTGSTTIGEIQYGTNGTPGVSGVMRLQGAVGQLTATSGITASDGSIFEINKNAGDSVSNARLGATTPISLTSSMVNLIGSGGFTTQNLGQLSVAGGSVIGVGLNGASQSVTFSNLTRSGSGTVMISGTNLGNAAAAVGLTNANVFLTGINGSAPSAALVGGGGGPGTTTISIIPWAIGDSQNSLATTSGTTSTTYGFGSGFVTYDTNGVRLLNAGTEYNVSNNLDTAGATDNVRTTSTTITGPTAAVTVNSLFVATTGATIAGTGSLNITSGALASNVAATTFSVPISFGAGGTGEAIVSVVGALGTANTITANGALTGSTLTKAGSGTLILGSASNLFTSNAINVNAGFITTASVNNLGISQASPGASTITFDMQTGNTGNGGLNYTGTGTEILNSNIVLASGHTPIRTNGAGGNLTLAGTISGPGWLNIDPTAASTLTLSGTNTYAGGTRIGSGTANILNITSDANLGAASAPLTINASGNTLKLGGTWNTSRQIAIEGAWGLTTGGTTGSSGLDTAGNNANWSGQILGASAIFKIDSSATPGVWTISSFNNPYSGTIQLGTSVNAGGTLAITGDINAASITFGPAAAGVAGTYVLDLSGATGAGWRQVVALNTGSGFTQAHTVQLGTTTPVDLRVGGGTFGGTQGAAAGGVIQGKGSLVIASGTFTLTGTSGGNTFTGDGATTLHGQVGVEVWGGTLQFAADNLLGNPTNAVAQKGGRVQLPSGTSVTTARDWVFQSSSYTLVGAGPDNSFNIQAATDKLEIDGQVSGFGGFEKTGPGTVYFTGNNATSWVQTAAVSNNGRSPYGGFIKINTGNIEFNSDANLGDGGNKIVLLSLSGAAAGGTLELAPGMGTLGSPVVINRQIFFQNANTNLGGIQVDTGSVLQYSGSLYSGSTTAQTLVKSGLGTLVLDANISNFVGNLNAGFASAAAGNITLTANARLPRVNVNLTAGSATTFDMSGLTLDMGSFVGQSGTTLALGSGGQLTTGFSNAAQTIAGAVTGDSTAGIFQVGTGTTTITAGLGASGSSFGGGYTVGYTGTLAITGAAGSLALQGNTGLTVGAWGSSANRGPILSLDSTGAHLNASQTIYLNTSELSVIGSATPVTQTMDSLDGVGYSIVTAGTTTAGANISFTGAVSGSALTQNSSATFLFRSGSTGTLGSAAASATLSNLKFATINGGAPASALVGGGGAAGTMNISILPFAVGDDTATGLGSTFVTYGANGVRTLQAGAGEYDSNLPAGAITNNVRLAPALLTTTTLAASTTINSLNIAGVAGGTLINSATNQPLVVTSGAILNTVSNVYTTNTTASGPVGLPIGIQTAELRTGSGNTAPLYVYATGGDLAIGAKVTTTGGFVMSGTGQVYLTNATNSYTGANNPGGTTTTVNGGTLVIDSLGAINDSATSSLVLAGGFLKYRGPSATMLSGGGINVGGFQANGTGLTGGINVVSGTNLALPDSNVFGTGGLVKDGTGTLTLTSTAGGNNYSGPTIIRGGQLAIDGPSALGLSPRVLFDASNAVSGTAGASLKFLAPMTLTQEVDIISSSANIGAGFDTNGQAVTLSGVVNGPNNNGMGLYKLGAGNLTLTAAEAYTGATQAFGGTLTIGGANGSILNSGINGSGSAFNTASSLLSNFGATIVLDNTTAANSNRIPSGFTTAMSGGDSQTNGGVRLNGGDFNLLGNASTAVNEYAGQFNIFAGTVTLQNNGAPTVLTSGRLVRANADTIGVIRGTGLGGGAPSATTSNWFLIDQGSGSTQLTGAGGAIGTPFINFLPGFGGAATATGTATDLVTYDSAVGIRLLTPSEYTTTFAGTIVSPNYDDSRSPIIGLSSSASAPSFATWVEAIKLSGSANLSGTAGLIVRQSTILATGNGSPAISVPVLGSFGNGGYDFVVAGTTNLAVSSNLNANQLFVYGGTGSNSTLTLSGSYYGAGQVFVGEGSTLALSGSKAYLNPLSSNLNVAVGGTFSLGGADRMVASINTQSLIGSFNLNQVSDGTIALGSNNLNLYDSVNSVFTGQITGTSSSTLTKGFFSSGTTTLTQPQTGFNGTVRVNNGTLQLAGSGTLPNASLIDIRGGTVVFNNSDDNASQGTYIAQRVSAATPINLAGGLTFTGNSDAIAKHNLGPIALVGGGTINVTPGINAPSTLTVANLTRAANRGTLTVVPTSVTGASTLVTSGFGGNGTGWTLNVPAGSTAGTGTVTTDNLELTTATASQASSAWWNTPVATGPFKASFTYTVAAASSPPADGITFGFQSAGLNALGGAGGSLGYGGAANSAGFVAVSPSAAFQLNIYPPNTTGGVGSGVGALVSTAVGGPATAPGTVAASAPVNAGLVNTPVNFSLTYDGTNLTIVQTQGANTFTSVVALNVAAVGPTAFIGFTGGTGGSNAEQHITNFTYSSLAISPTLGLAQAENGGSRILLSSIEGGSPALALSGGGGTAGTTTISILPWGWSTNGSFLTYDPTNGIRPLNISSGTGAEYLTTLTSGLNTFDNVRVATAQTLTAATEVNSLITTNGNVGGAFDLTLRSGALASTTAGTIGAIGNNLKTGLSGANTSELVIFNGAATTLNYSVGTSGGLTKFGGGALTLAGVNTFTGGLQINGGTVVYSNDNQLGAAGSAVTFGLPTNAASPNGLGLQYTGSVLTTPAITRNFITNSFGGIIGPVNQVTTLNNTISGTGTFAYNGTAASAIYEINGTNSYSGDTYLNFGQLGIANDSAFGNSQVIQVNSGTSTDGFDARGNWTSSRTIQMRSAGGIDTNGFTVTWNGPIIGTAGLTKQNEGTLVLTAANPTTGAITLNSGGVRLFNGGALNVIPVMGFGTQLILDDTGTHYSDRLPENAGTLSGSNYELALLGNSSTTTEEVIGSLTLGAASKVTVAAGAGQAAILRLGQGAILTRSTGSSIVFRGTNLGTAAPGTPNVANIMVFNPTASAAALTGGGGPAGSSAISIIAGAFGDTSATGNGTQLVTYDFTNGIRLLNASEYATVANYPNGINGTNTVDNLHLTASNSTIANATTTNALWLDGSGGGISLSGAGNFTITAGNILVTGTGNTLAVPVIGGTAANAIAVGGPGDLNITTAIPAANTGGLIKTGNGNLTLSAADAYTGTTYLSSGTLTINNAAAITGGTTFRVLGGTLAAGQAGLTMASTVAVALDGDLTFGGNFDYTIAGNMAFDSGQRQIAVNAGRTLTLSGVVSASNNGIAGSGLVKNGPGTLILTGNNTYGGVAATPGFYLTQTVVNAGELRVNGQTGTNSGTGGSTVSINNTGTVLSGNGTIIPTQQLQARNLVNINSGAILSPGMNTANPNGTLLPGTLTMGATTTPGVTTAEVHENAASIFRFLYTSSPLPVAAAPDSGGSETAGSTTGNNLLAVNGALFIDPAADFQIFGNANDFAPGSTYSFEIATATSIPNAYSIDSNTNPSQFDTSNFANFNPATMDLTVHTVGNNEYLNISAVPEPSTLLATGAAALGLLGAIRRRRRAAAAKK